MRAGPVSRSALAILDRISSELSTHVDVASTLEAALGTLVSGLSCSAGWIVLVDPGDDDTHAGRGFRLAAHHGLPPALDLQREAVWGFTCCCEALLRGGRLSRARNEMQCPRLDGLRRARGTTLAHASAPLTWQGRELGVLNLTKPDWRAFQVAELDVLMRAGHLIAAAVGRTQRYERMQRRIEQEHQALLDLSRELLEHRDPRDLMRHLVAAVHRLTDSDASALLLLADEGRGLRFEACTGWRTRPCARKRMLAFDARCSPWESMQRRQPLAVPDARDGELDAWAERWVREEGFRAQVVVPLVVGEAAIGVLVVHKRKPQPWKDSVLQFLHVMANQAAVALDTALLRQGVRAHRHIDAELAVARRIQGGLLPAELPRIRGWRFRRAQEMARPIGGDFYDVLRWTEDPERLGFAIGDAAGKGIGGALLMAQGLESLRSAATQPGDPVGVLQRVNDRVDRACDSGHFLTCFYGELDTRTGTLRFANAGHERPLVYRAVSRDVEEISASGTALGILPDCHAVLRVLQLDPGDVLVLYSDGVTEARDAAHELFGDQRLRQAVRRGGRSGDVLTAVLDAVHGFTGEAQASDDVTVLLLERLPAPLR